jgi:hypothetical protein
VLPAVAAILLSSCSLGHHDAVQPVPKAGTSRLVVYRMSDGTEGFVGPFVRVDGLELGKLLKKTCFEASLEAGDYQLKSEGTFYNWSGPPEVMRLVLEPNTVRYVELVVFPGQATTVNHVYANRTGEEAKEAIAKIGKCAIRQP